MPAKKNDGTAAKATSRKNKSSKTDNLVRISALDFTEGMFVGTELYVLLNDNYVLLCSNAVMSRDLIAKINDFELTGDALYIDASYYNKMTKHYKPPEALSAAVISKEYNQIKTAAADAFRAIGADEQVPWNQTTKLVMQITDQIKFAEAPFILQCISALRSTDQYLYTHCVNVSLLNGLMAKWLGKTPKESEELVNIGLLHDIGKLRIASSILDKPGRLTDEEFTIMKKHPLYSQEMLEKSGVSDKRMLRAVRAHHERMNGRGYPDALSADKIPEAARITAISDIYDAMVAKRVYKEPCSPFEVMEQFARDRFSHLDIHLVNIFLTHMSMELMGKRVKMSNGTTGEVLYVDKEKFNYPIVRIGTATVRTNDQLFCVTIIDDSVE